MPNNVHTDFIRHLIFQIITQDINTYGKPVKENVKKERDKKGGICYRQPAAAHLHRKKPS